MGERRRRVVAKPGEIRLWYGRLDGDAPDLCSAWGGGGACSSDARLVSHVIGNDRWTIDGYPNKDPALYKELERRGYDLSTLEFRIRKLPPALASQDGKK